MGKINSSTWRQFKICDLFDVQNAHTILWKDIEPESGTYPYVTASEGNNAVVTRISYDVSQLEKGNSIMIGGKTLVVSYQPEDFFSNDSHNLILQLKDTDHRSEDIQLFLVTALKASIGHLYSWGDSISKRSIQKDFITLPAQPSGEPDWQHMESYIKKVKEIASSKIAVFSECL